VKKRETTEAAGRSIQRTQFVLVPEAIYLLQQHHVDRFAALMNRCLPQWRAHRQQQITAPAAKKIWNCLTRMSIIGLDRALDSLEEIASVTPLLTGVIFLRAN